jgi:putative membrane protein
MHGWHMGWYTWWPMWPFGMVVFAALLVVAVWALVRTVRAEASKPSESAEDIVKRRYARGEIDHDTFERMLGDLHMSSGRPA